MASIEYKSIFWIWLNATSAAAVTGHKEIAGGQVHIAFAHNKIEMDAFFAQSSASKSGRDWQVPLAQYGDISARLLGMTEPAPNLQRRTECRIPAQGLNSKLAYPLWRRTVLPIPKDAEPRQCILLIRDTRDTFHLRLLDANSFDRLPPNAVKALLVGRSVHGRNNHLYKHEGYFPDIDCPDYRSNPLAMETGVSGSLPGAPITSPKSTEDNHWDELADYVRQVENRSRAQRLKQVQTVLRDSRVRDVALQCFGERCQVRGCPFTANIPIDILPYVLEVHHLTAVAKGGSDSLFNLAILCANHHRFCERLPNRKAIQVQDSDDVIITYDGGSFLIERDLSPLRQRLEK